MKQIIIALIAGLSFTGLNAQTVSELYKQRDFKALIEFEKAAGKLSGEELYMVGFAFFRLENDVKAIEFYDKAIAKGADDAGVHFYKGLSLRYLEKYNEALKEIETALVTEPTNQEYMNEKGVVYYYMEKYDKALEVFELAKKLPRTFPEPFYWYARVFHKKQDFKRALTEYYEALKNLPEDNGYYVTTLAYIGQLEYTFTKDYRKSAEAYYKAVKLDPEDYEISYKLMKSLNADKQYDRADSVFNVVKKAFDEGKLPKEDMEIKTVAIAQFEWNGQTAVVRRSLLEPEKTLDITYKVFLLSKDGDKVERRFVVEKTIELEKNGPRYLLCEQDKKTGGHKTYPYGWRTDVIPVESLQKAVLMILDDKMKEGASSSFK